MIPNVAPLIAAGLKPWQIARRLGISRERVYRIATKEGVSVKPNRRAQILAVLSGHYMTTRQIADAIGADGQAVRYLMREFVAKGRAVKQGKFWRLCEMNGGDV